MATYDEENIFAKILDGKIPCFKVYETSTSLAMLDAFPQAEGHCLIMPKAKGSTAFLDMKMGPTPAFFRDMQKVANAVQKAFGADGVTIRCNNGAASGQTVFHPHFHIVPRKEGDKYDELPAKDRPAKEMLKAEAAEPLLEKLKEALKPPPKPLKKAKFFKVSSINPDGSGLNLKVQILAKPTEVEGKGKATFYEALCADASASVVLSLTADQAAVCKEGAVVELRNASVVMVKSHIRVRVDKWGKVAASEEGLEGEVNKEKNISDTEYELVKS